MLTPQPQTVRLTNFVLILVQYCPSCKGVQAVEVTGDSAQTICLGFSIYIKCHFVHKMLLSGTVCPLVHCSLRRILSSGTIPESEPSNATPGTWRVTPPWLAKIHVLRAKSRMLARHRRQTMSMQDGTSSFMYERLARAFSNISWSSRPKIQRLEPQGKQHARSDDHNQESL